MTKEEILKSVKNEIDYCEMTTVNANPAFAKMQTNLIDLIEKYCLFQYRDGDFDSFGNPRPFYDSITFPLGVATKLVESDVKDIKVISEDEDYWTSYVMQKELHQYNKDNYFGNFLNDLAYDNPKYGHTFVKKVEGKIDIVPLSNLRFRPDAVDTSRIPIIERHIYQPDEFLLEAKERGWENTDLVNLKPSEVIDNGVANTNPKLQVFEAWFPPNFLDTEYNYFIISGDGVMLAYMNMPKRPYKDLSWEKVRGRSIGRGQVEKLFPEIIYMNRLATEKSEGLAWTSRHLFQSRDNTLGRQLLMSADNGTLFHPNDPIEPIAMEERNLSFYNQDEYKWESNALRKTFSGEQPQSKSVPANARAQAINYQIQSGYYKTKREKMNNFVKEIIVDWIIPDFKNNKRKEHDIVIRNLLSGDMGSDKLFQLVVSQRVEERKFESLMNGRLISPDEEKVLRSTIAETVKNEKIKIPKGIYDDVMNRIDIIIGNESLDLDERKNNLMLLSNMVNNNPGSFTPSEVKSIKRKLMEASGFNPHELGGDEPIPSIQEQITQQRLAQPGGSISRPQSAQLPQINNQTATA